jgi:hypothetical protein
VKKEFAMALHKKLQIWFFVLTFCPFVYAQNRSYKYVLKTDSPLAAPAPLYIDLEGVNYNTDTQQMVLYRIDSGRRTPIPCQIENGHTARLWFIQDASLPKNRELTFEVAFENAKTALARMTASVDANAIILQSEGQNILRYYYAVHDVPGGVKPIYRRSGFIHPLWSPAGNVLTRIQPPDHYHHYGIWNPWTKTHIEGREVDFWNLDKGQGTVRFAGVLSVVSGPVYAGYKVRQEHVVLKPKEKVAINELADVRAYSGRINDRPVWIIDYTSTLHNALNTTIELVNYRYGGGIGFRATEQWAKENCAVLTSEGKARKDADGTRARWCDVNGTFGDNNQISGIVFFSHTANRQHPEPMRVWPPDMVNGRGDLFFEFCPIRHESWNLEPQKEYVLRYRMIVYDGKIAPEIMEALWQSYTHPPAVVRKIK